MSTNYSKRKNIATFLAILAAALYAINAPISKVLLEHTTATMMAAFLYLGAGVGMFICDITGRLLKHGEKKESLTTKELPYTIAMVVLDIAAPIFLMFGIERTNSASVSLLNNFEIVVTSFIALWIFKEMISKRLWMAIALVTIASILLTVESGEALAFNEGSLWVLAACACWGFENNCTKMISNKSSTEIVVIKGVFSGAGSLVMGLILGEDVPQLRWILVIMALGFVAYGLSIKFYIMAQKDLGAVKTSAYYSIAPFLGVVFSMVILGERPKVRFYIALALMIISTIMMIKDSIALQHTHEHIHTHCHEHRHGDIVHSHEHSHMHSHQHVHGTDEEAHGHSHDEEKLRIHMEEEHMHIHENT